MPFFNIIKENVIQENVIEVFDEFNLLFNVLEIGIPSILLIMYLFRHLSRERRNHRMLLREYPEDNQSCIRKYKVARVKYSLMLTICFIELFLILSISIPNMAFIFGTFFENSSVLTTEEYLCKNSTGELFFAMVSTNWYLRPLYIAYAIALLALFFFIRCLCVVLNNVYIERKDISNFKAWLFRFGLEVLLIAILGMFLETLPFEVITFLVLYSIEYVLLVKAINKLRKSVVLRNFEMKRDYPNSNFTLKSHRDAKYFNLTSKFALVFLFFYGLTFVLWSNAEVLLTIILNFPCYLNHVYGIDIKPQMLVDSEIATLFYNFIHLLQNTAFLIANVTLLLLYIILIGSQILKHCRRKNSTNPASYALRNPELITALINYNNRCYLQKNIHKII